MNSEASFETAVKNVLADELSKSSRGVAPRPSQLATTKEGISIAVYRGIAAATANESPTDYEMQVSVIKMQVEACKKLHPCFRLGRGLALGAAVALVLWGSF